MKRSREFQVARDTLVPLLKAKCFPELDGELDKVEMGDSGDDGVVFHYASEVSPGVVSNEIASLDVKEIRDIAIEYVRSVAKINGPGSCSCQPTADLSAIVTINETSRK